VELTAAKLSELEEIAFQIRRLSVEMIAWGKWGHIGGSFSMAELLSSFPGDERPPAAGGLDGRDRLVLSKARVAGALRGPGAARFLSHRRASTPTASGGFEGTPT
jgi:transketolase N-terminal domain/subunit